MPVFNTDSASFSDVELSASFRAATGTTINFVPATLVTGSFTGRGSGLTQVTASFLTAGANTTASNSTTASFSIYATTASYLVSNLSGSNPPHTPGTVFYDTSSYTLVYYNDNTQMMVNVGQEGIIRVFNSASNTIQNGAATYISSSFNNIPCAWLAIADGTRTKFNFAGVATTTINPFTYGYITLYGRVNGLSVNLPTGSPLWLSSTTSGSFQTTQPAFPSEQVFVGTLVASGSGTSTILVSSNEHAYGAITASYSQTSSYTITSSYVSGRKGFVWFPIQSAKLPSTSSARIDAGNRTWRLLFDPTSNQSASWQFVIPPDYASSPKIYMKYSVTAAQGIPVSSSAWAFKTAAVGQGITVDTFTTASTVLTASVSSSQAANTMITTSLSLTNSTNITASEMLVFEVERLASNVIDTVSTDVAIHGLMFEYVTL